MLSKRQPTTNRNIYPDKTAMAVIVLTGCIVIHIAINACIFCYDAANKTKTRTWLSDYLDPKDGVITGVQEVLYTMLNLSIILFCEKRQIPLISERALQ